mgnify:CR=1 FL=1
MIIETRSAQETYELGLKIGKEAKKGQVYTMVGDLGVGKTVFTQGIAEGLGIREPICSPTFTIVQVYEEGRMPFYHLMFTVSGILKRWMRSDMRTIFMEMVCA